MFNDDSEVQFIPEFCVAQLRKRRKILRCAIRKSARNLVIHNHEKCTGFDEMQTVQFADVLEL